MNFAINYSPQAATLLSEGRIQIDYFKCPDWPDLITEAREYKPGAVHFEIIASAGNLTKKDWSLVDRLLEETGTYYINIHLASNIKEFPGFDIHSQDADQRKQIVDKLIADDRIRELHFAGIHVLHGILRDHLSIQPQDWPVLEWVLGNIRRGEWSQPWMLAFEYGGIGEAFEWRSDPKVIAEQVPRLYRLVNPIA